MIASANIVADGTITAEVGISAVTHVGTGVYQLTLTNPPANMANAAIVATPIYPGGFQPAGQIVVLSATNPNLFEIATFDGTGAATDRSFSVVVYNLTP